jgi:hypothetical protein
MVSPFPHSLSMSAAILNGKVQPLSEIQLQNDFTVNALNS